MTVHNLFGGTVPSDVDGYVLGVRFYKAAANSGPHLGCLWDAGGTLLASVTFTGESASGWQEMNFAAPVPIVANGNYVIGYHAPWGNYSATSGFFTSQFDNAPLHGKISNGTPGNNGRFHYGGNPLTM